MGLQVEVSYNTVISRLPCVQFCWRLCAGCLWSTLAPSTRIRTGRSRRRATERRSTRTWTTRGDIQGTSRKWTTRGDIQGTSRKVCVQCLHLPTAVCSLLTSTAIFLLPLPCNTDPLLPLQRLLSRRLYPLTAPTLFSRRVWWRACRFLTG